MPQKKKTNTNKGKRSTLSKAIKRKILVFSSLSAFTLLALAFLFFLFVYWGAFGPIPTEKELAKIDNDIASEIYAIDNTLMGKYYHQNRMSIENKVISKHATNALIATEDSRFFEHEGYDLISLARVLVRTIILRDHRQGGGSTISQQLSKNLFPRQSYGPFSVLANKTKEIFTASRIENVYSKDEILILYLNTVPFGEDVYGIEAASQRFFDKTAAKLEANEAAVLIGMLAANTAYNPRLHPKKSTRRRNLVLSRMEEQGFLTPEDAEKHKASPLELHYHRIDHNSGISPYFRDLIKRKAIDILKETYGEHYDLYTDGLKIYTTIDPVMQNYAEEAVHSHMSSLQKQFDKHWKNNSPWQQHPEVFTRELHRSPRYKKLKAQGKSEEEIIKAMQKPEKMTIFGYPQERSVNMSPYDAIAYYLKTLNTGFMVMDPESGHILSWVGGIDHKYFQYDHVTSRRQVGSTFKPIVYATALENGMSPCDYISNERRIYEDYDNWSPANSDDIYDGYYSMKGGLSHSVNTITAEVMVQTGTAKVLALAQDMGIQSTLPAVPSISLGTGEISLQEMLTAYSCFANEGEKTEVISLLRIEDRKGNILYKHRTTPHERVLSEGTAQLMNYMLQGVINNGTGQRLRTQYHLRSQIAGKTGTTQNNADGWFIGYTPNLVAGAWVGAQSPKVHFRTTALGQGAHTALPIYALFMKKLETDSRYRKYTKSTFTPLAPEEAALVECVDYSLTDPEKNIFDSIFSQDKKEENNEIDSLKLQKKTDRKLRKEERKKEREEKGGWFRKKK